MISYGADATLEENPFELGLGRLVDLEMEAPSSARRRCSGSRGRASNASSSGSR